MKSMEWSGPENLVPTHRETVPYPEERDGMVAGEREPPKGMNQLSS